MSEQAILDEVFGKPMWKDRWPLSWCDLCDVAIISCPENGCDGTSCNGGGCEACSAIQGDFMTAKRKVQSYLTAEENKVLEKAWWLKKYILESLAHNEYEINWRRMKMEGQLCERAEELFANEIYLDEITNMFKKPLTKSENSGNIKK